MGSQTLVGGEVEDITFSKIQKVLETFDDQVTFPKKQYVKTIEKRDDFLDAEVRERRQLSSWTPAGDRPVRRVRAPQNLISARLEPLIVPMDIAMICASMGPQTGSSMARQRKTSGTAARRVIESVEP